MSIKLPVKSTALASCILLLLTQTSAHAQDSGFIAVPASAFVSQHSSESHGNLSGTAKFFESKLFAPVNIPHNRKVTFFRCGGRGSFKHRINFVLLRNQPQQANVSLASVKTSFDGTGFEIVTAAQIEPEAAIIHNGHNNYFITAEIDEPNLNAPTLGTCEAQEDCWVGFCTIGYTDNINQGTVGAEDS